MPGAFCGTNGSNPVPSRAESEINILEPRMRRQKFKIAADDDSLPVIVPKNDKAGIPISPERVRRLRKHLVVTLRALRRMKSPEHSVSPLRPEPEGFAGHVARTACSLCKGSCCKNGEDHAFLDETTIARVHCAGPALDARAVLRLYVERVPEVGYQNSCIFHGKQGCTLDRSLRSDVCNSYFCGGLQVYLTGDDIATPTMIIAGAGDKMRTSPILMPKPAREFIPAEEGPEPPVVSGETLGRPASWKNLDPRGGCRGLQPPDA
jgi:hypothetical protein